MLEHKYKDSILKINIMFIRLEYSDCFYTKIYIKDKLIGSYCQIDDYFFVQVCLHKFDWCGTQKQDFFGGYNKPKTIKRASRNAGFFIEEYIKNIYFMTGIYDNYSDIIFKYIFLLQDKEDNIKLDNEVIELNDKIDGYGD